MKTAVVGSGAWGTALAIRLCQNGHDVTMWTYEKDLIPEMKAFGLCLQHRLRALPRISAVVQNHGKSLILNGFHYLLDVY